jgi:hypothetical protein
VLIAESIHPNRDHIGGRGINTLTGRRSGGADRRRRVPRQQGLGEESDRLGQPLLPMDRPDPPRGPFLVPKKANSILTSALLTAYVMPGWVRRAVMTRARSRRDGYF